MKNYPHILSKVYGEPWCIRKEKHAAIRMILGSKMTGDSVGVMYDGDKEPGEVWSRGGTLVIPVYGIIGKHLSSLEMVCGGFSLDHFCEVLQDASDDDAVEKIILDFDTPGGTVTGVPEGGKLIAGIEKEIIGYTETECCSAGYWLMSQCDSCFCTESAIVGSIGVYCIYIDQTRALEMDGIKVNAISEGEYKLAGAPFKAMTDAEMAMFQDRVKGIYDKFTGAVTSNREVHKDCMEGQVFYGEEAVTQKLCDGLVDSIEDLIE